MSSSPLSASRIHPLVAAAAISVTVLSLAGIGAMTGLLPTPFARSGESAGAALTASPAAPAAVAKPHRPAPTASAVSAVRTPAVETDHRSATPRTGPPQVARVPAIDPNQATVLSIDRVEDAGEGSGIGAIGGGVVGGVLGNQVGGGNGRKAMTVLGAIGGAVAGNAIEKNMKSNAHFDVRVRLSDGSTRVLRYAEQPQFQPGDRIRLDSQRAS